MCQRLYVAARTPLMAVKRTKQAPYLDLQVLGRDASAIRSHFRVEDLPHLYVAGAHSACGCGFPEEYSEAKHKRRIRPPEERATMERLAQALRPAVKGRPRVQLLLCWLGTEDEAVSTGRTVDLAQLLAPDFRFRNGEILSLIKGGAEQADAADERHGQTGGARS